MLPLIFTIFQSFWNVSVAKLIVKLMGERETIKLFEKSAGSVSFSSIIHLNQFDAHKLVAVICCFTTWTRSALKMRRDALCYRSGSRFEYRYKALLKLQRYLMFMCVDNTFIALVMSHAKQYRYLINCILGILTALCHTRPRKGKWKHYQKTHSTVHHEVLLPI